MNYFSTPYAQRDSATCEEQFDSSTISKVQDRSTSSMAKQPQKGRFVSIVFLLLLTLHYMYHIYNYI